jgi:hypothetical protein
LPPTPEYQQVTGGGNLKRKREKGKCKIKIGKDKI